VRGSGGGRSGCGCSWVVGGNRGDWTRRLVRSSRKVQGKGPSSILPVFSNDWVSVKPPLVGPGINRFLSKVNRLIGWWGGRGRSYGFCSSGFRWEVPWYWWSHGCLWVEQKLILIKGFSTL